MAKGNIEEEARATDSAQESPVVAGDSDDMDAGVDQEPASDGEDPIDRLITAVQQDGVFSDSKLNKPVADYVQERILDYKNILDKYNIFVYYDENRLTSSDADNLYKCVRESSGDKPLLLVLHSIGGSIEPAYFMSKICREHTDKEFHVAVPRRAKSAATLLACGADKIHMGSMSELGPIDPQIKGLPVLALKSALKDIADMTVEAPGASNLFATYLSKVLKLEQLGYYERVAESACQYAERLLKARKSKPGRAPDEISRDLVYQYKDHGFVIDAKEAGEVFGDGTVVTGTEEYQFSDALYTTLRYVAMCVDLLAKRRFYYVGDLSSGANTMQKRS